MMEFHSGPATALAFGAAAGSPPQHRPRARIQNLWLAGLLAWVGLFAGGVAITVAAAPAADGPPARQLLRDGNAALRAGDAQHAIEILTDAQQSARTNHDDAVDADASTALAQAQNLLGWRAAAIGSLREALLADGRLGDARRRMQALEVLGSVCTLAPDLAPAVAMDDPAMAEHSAHLQRGGMPSQMSGMTMHSAAVLPMGDAGTFLSEALAIAQSIPDAQAAAAICNDQGNYLASVGNYDQALARYDQCAASADPSHRILTVEALSNSAVTAAAGAAQAGRDSTLALQDDDAEEADAARVRRDHFGDRCLAYATQACTAADDLPSSSRKALLVCSAGEAAMRMQLLLAAPDTADHPATAGTRAATIAAEAFEKAREFAVDAGDLRTASYACGGLGRLNELEHHRAAAMSFTRQAELDSQQVQDAYALYQWEWQSGRLLEADQLPRAIAAFRHAVETLKQVRSDLAVSQGTHPQLGSFRENVGQLYYDLADALLRQADERVATGAAADGSPAVQNLLIEARDTIEILKSAELEDFFQDRCVQQLKQRSRSVDDLLHDQPNTIVVYIISLPDRTEMLISSDRGLHRLKVPVGADELARTVGEFRSMLTYVPTDEYLGPAATLYRWLIAPIESSPDHLISPGGTMIFVPDGALRTVPMAALYDAATRQHLVEKYALAITPGLTLMEPRPFTASSATILLSGLSDAVQVHLAGGQQVAYPALPNVPLELQRVDAIFNGSGPSRASAQATPIAFPQVLPDFHPPPVQELLNRRFIQSQLAGSLNEGDYSVVHMASHGHFGGSMRDTYLVTYDGGQPLHLDDIERLIRPKEFRGEPIELLTLSACETAAGDDRAALGLAGVAIKAGARSALATLWCVNDATTSSLIGEFYRQLRDGRHSKAQALRAAQLKLIRSNDYSLRHPYLWAPYLIIGNWL